MRKQFFMNQKQVCFTSTKSKFKTRDLIHKT